MDDPIKLSDYQVKKNQYDLGAEILRFIAYMNNKYGMKWRDTLTESVIDYESTNFWKI